MKKILFAAVLTVLIACGGSKTTTKNTVGNSIESGCPKNGECLVEVIKDSALVKKENSGGRPYFDMESKPGKTVIKYYFNKKDNPVIQDDSYREEIMIETDSDLSKLSSANTKVVFGVFCFCRDRAGYYEVKNTTTEYKNNQLHITLPEVVSGQLTHSLVINIK